MSLDTPSLPPGPPCAAPGEAPPTHSRTAADLLRRVVAARDLDKQQCPPPAWLWHGYLGPGKANLAELLIQYWGGPHDYSARHAAIPAWACATSPLRSVAGNARRGFIA